VNSDLRSYCFLDALSNGTPVRTTIEDGIKALELAELATQPWREGRVLSVGA
jgi:myo-inositol 2-dehydrogenase / D-chiro-inositol 1-dehydrogenase